MNSGSRMDSEGTHDGIARAHRMEIAKHTGWNSESTQDGIARHTGWNSGSQDGIARATGWNSGSQDGNSESTQDGIAVHMME